MKIWFRGIVFFIVSIIFLGISNVSASVLDYSDEILEDNYNNNSLESVLKSVRVQLEEQDAEDLYGVYKDIIIRKYNNIHNGYNVLDNSLIETYSTTRTNGSGKIYYYLNNREIECTDLYLSSSQTKKYYDDLVYGTNAGTILEGILGLINGSMNFGPYKQYVFIRPLQDIINDGTGRANILSSVDNTDMARKTIVVIDWGRNYPYMTYPDNARGVRITTPLNI